MEADGFLRRWSRLKGGNPQIQPQPQPQPPVTAAVPAAPPPTGPAALPTLEEAMRLTPESDYSAFVAQGVDKAVRRLALKKLFADPHFNQLDGLDIYMGDYNRADPLPASMLAALRQAQGFLQKECASAERDADMADMADMADKQDGDRQQAESGSSPMPAADATRGDQA
jgi:hypothetical protein